MNDIDITTKKTTLTIEDLSISFMVAGKKLPAVDHVSFSVSKGEILAIVGESGCGKTVSCLSLARLLPEPPTHYDGGCIRFFSKDGASTKNVLTMSAREIREVRRKKIAYVFQEPSVSLNPVFTIYDQISEVIALREQKSGNHSTEVIALLSKVGIPDPASKMRSYPHELSGGMQQRVMIAMALASEPEILVADEPTTALDVTIQAQILDLIRKLRDQTAMSVIIVTHNLGIVSEIADNVIVMYAGHVMEKGTTADVISSPIHPYTKALLAAVPCFGFEKEKLLTIPGNVPSPSKYPQECRFFGRCSLSETLSALEKKKCENEVPLLVENNRRASRCHFSK